MHVDKPLITKYNEVRVNELMKLHVDLHESIVGFDHDLYICMIQIAPKFLYGRDCTYTFVLSKVI